MATCGPRVDHARVLETRFPRGLAQTSHSNPIDSGLLESEGM